MVEVFREVRRVLRPDGTLWLNLGDSYNGSGGAGGDYGPGGLKEGQPKYPGRKVGGLKPKDLCMIPARVALALQADGWYLRSCIPWVKRNPMPESATDRPGVAHEYVFLLAKSPRYYYDPDAVRVPAVSTHGDKPSVPKSLTFKRENSKRAVPIPGQSKGTHRPDREDTVPNPDGRYRRTNDWWYESLDHIREHGGLLTDEDGEPLGFMVNTEPFKAAHFAVWPQKLVQPMILAGTSPQACQCGAPWKRITSKEKVGPVWNQRGERTGQHLEGNLEKGRGKFPVRYEVSVTTTGWHPTCSCPPEVNDGSGKCVVLDPFAGSGTTLMVAAQLGRAAIGYELNPDYCEIARKRINGAQRRFEFG